MPTNVTPEYKRAEADFRSARTPEDRLAGLREMLRTVPKHKGTEHLQADIRSRIKELTDELAGPRKGGAQTGPAHVVHPDGAGQVVLLGSTLTTRTPIPSPSTCPRCWWPPRPIGSTTTTTSWPPSANSPAGTTRRSPCQPRRAPASTPSAPSSSTASASCGSTPSSPATP